MIFYISQQMKNTYSSAEVAIVNTQVKKGFFLDTQPISQLEDDFHFAVAITTHHSYQKESTNNFLEYGKLKLRYRELEGDKLIDQGEIEMEPCNNFTVFHSHYSENVDSLI